MSYQKIVVGTDGSPTAEIAEETAAHLAHAFGAVLLIVHAHQSSSSDGPDGILARARERAETAGGRAETIGRAGSAGDVLVEVADQEVADLVVLGNVGMPGRIRARLPSVPNYVSHRTPCDLLLVNTVLRRPLPVAERYRRMLIGTDGSRTATEAVRRGVEIAETLGARPTLLFVGEERRGRSAFEKTLEAVPAGDIETRIVPGQPVDGICETAGKEGFGLIVVGNKGMSSAGKFTLESVPDRVSHFAPTDVLVVRTVAAGVRDLREGEGALVMAGGRRLAAYRDEHGDLHAVSPKCTHMGCTVAWNRRERSWDCPCHGSRYTYEGEVLEGPATKALERQEIEES